MIPERLEELRTLVAMKYPIFLVDNEVYKQIQKESHEYAEKAGVEPIAYDDFYTLSDLYEIGIIQVRDIKLWSKIYRSSFNVSSELSKMGLDSFGLGQIPLDIQFTADVNTVDPLEREDLHNSYRRNEIVNFLVDPRTFDDICNFYTNGVHSK